MSDATSAADPSLNTPARPAASNFWVAVLLAVMVGQSAMWVPWLTGLPLVKIAFVFAAIRLYRVRGSLVPVRVRSLKIAQPAIAFLTLSVVSIVFSVYRSNTLIASQASIIYLCAMILLVRTTWNERDLERLLFGLAAGAASLTVGVLLNYHGGRATINENFDPNDIAYNLDTLLPIVLALRVGRSRMGRLLLNSLALGMILAVLLTGSRGGAIGLGVVLVLVTAFPMDQMPDGTLRKFSMRGLLARGALVGLAGLALWGALPGVIQERLQTLTDLGNDYNADPTSNAARTVIWRRDLMLALERPIGYGLGSAPTVDWQHGGQYRTAHNSLVQAFLELGVLGLLLYVYCYYICWRELRRLARRGYLHRPDDPKTRAALYARALAVALAGNLAAGFFLSQAYSEALWMIVAVCAAFVRIETVTNPAAPSSDTGPGASHPDQAQRLVPPPIY